MTDIEYLNQKRLEVLSEIKPICDVFKITDYDYVVSETAPCEILRVYDTKIGCSCNSISAVVNELIGFIFIRTWCRNRSLGAFAKQSENVIKRYWIKEE